MHQSEVDEDRRNQSPNLARSNSVEAAAVRVGDEQVVQHLFRRAKLRHHGHQNADRNQCDGQRGKLVFQSIHLVKWASGNASPNVRLILPGKYQFDAQADEQASGHAAE